MNNIAERTKVQPKSNIDQLQLSKSEIEVVLSILKEGSFPVKNIEELYKALIKLQEQHKQLNK